MATMEDYAKLSRDERLERLQRGPDDVAVAIRAQDEAVLARRPDAKNWAAKEIVCHVRDIEELFMGRFQLIMAADDPKLSFDPATPDRWADERQYLRNDAADALAAFRRRREESLALLRTLTAEQWARGGIHAVRGRMTIDDFVTLIAWHDENHLDQLKRALDGKP